MNEMDLKFSKNCYFFLPIQNFRNLKMLDVYFRHTVYIVSGAHKLILEYVLKLSKS